MKEIRKESMFDCEIIVYYVELDGMYKVSIDKEFLRFTYSNERFALKEARDKVRQLHTG